MFPGLLCGRFGHVSHERKKLFAPSKGRKAAVPPLLRPVVHHNTSLHSDRCNGSDRYPLLARDSNVQGTARERTSATWFLGDALSLRHPLPVRRHCLLFSVIAFAQHDVADDALLGYYSQTRRLVQLAADPGCEHRQDDPQRMVQPSGNPPSARRDLARSTVANAQAPRRQRYPASARPSGPNLVPSGKARYTPR